MTKKKEQTIKVNILSRPLAAFSDGNSISIDNNDIVEVVFYQKVRENKSGKSDSIDMQGVSAIRMTFNQFKAFNKTIKSTIERHELIKKVNE